MKYAIKLHLVYEPTVFVNADGEDEARKIIETAQYPVDIGDNKQAVIKSVTAA